MFALFNFYYQRHILALLKLTEKLSMSSKERCKAYLNSIEDFNSKEKHDLVLLKGVLIHIEHKELKKVYEKIVDLSKKRVLIVEYFSRTPTELLYHGQEGKLFKRDFAHELIEATNVSLVASGFSSRLMKFPQDDLDWYLFEK